MKLIKFLALSPITSWFFELGYKFFYRFRFEKELIPIQNRQIKNKKMEEKLQILFKDKTVLNGPFKGMVYPNFYSYGSSLYSKFLGTYENELNEVWERFREKQFDKIIDVGCAEGYYAVGLSKLFPKTKVEAYDIIEEARNACKMLSDHNKAANIEVKEFFGPNDIEKLNEKSRNLIIVDCEGFEYELFTKKNVAHLRNSTLIIELHDLVNQRISPHIKNLFKNSHKIELVLSKNALEKIDGIKLIEELSIEEKLFGFNERTSLMQWMILTPLK